VNILKDPSLFRETFYADGQWHKGGVEIIKVVNPATGEAIGSVPKATLEDTRAAIDAAHAAFPDWAARPAKERSAIMRRWFELTVENADDLGKILTMEQGKPFPEARGEILYGAAFLEWFAEDAKRISGETIPAPTRDKRMIVIRQPIGVCAAITPWNFPMAMIARKAGPALAAGCTMVLKPASATPFSALALAVLAERAGVPKGVFNVLTGSAGVVGNELATNPTIRKITFTGSTDVGRELMAKAAGTVKKVALELGGNAPLIVFDDALLETAVQGALASKFRNMGQTCVCANRIYVQDGIYDAFVARFAEVVSAMKVGNGMEDGVIQGPLIDEAAIAKVEEHVRDALEGGARIVTGGKRHKFGGTFYEPTVIADAKQTMKIAHEETFGPVAPIFRFKEENEVIRLANDTEYGLSAYFFTRDLARTWRVAEALEVGQIGINTGITAFEGAPFGGVKASGIGREGSHHSIDEFLELKYLCLGDMT
jgi:succinate-semialdehyde dehydrogenase/glutarate-semialdehyde dehydrogenase